jgi:hypothetical protein
MNWVASIDFRLDGLRGRHVSVVRADHASMARCMGWAAFEEEAIEMGLPTAECGCCLAGYQVEYLGAHAEVQP